MVECPEHGQFRRRFAAITVPVTTGFPAIEAAMAVWIGDQEVEWFFGNVYDEGGDALNWWL